MEEGEAVGRWLGVVSRAVVGAVKEGSDERDGEKERRGKEDEDEDEDGDEDVDVGDWNVVQNNGMYSRYPIMPQACGPAVFVLIQYLDFRGTRSASCPTCPFPHHTARG